MRTNTLILVSMTALLPAGALAQAEAEADEETEADEASAETTEIDEAPAEPPSGYVDEGPSAPVITHLPVHQIPVDAPLDLEFDVRYPQQLVSVAVHYRPIGEATPPVRVAAERVEEFYVAEIPREDLAWPGVEYWATARVRDRGEVAVFASAEDPHQAWYQETETETRSRRLLESVGGHRARVELRGGYVALGKRAITTPTGETQLRSEHYYELEAAFGYSFYSGFVDGIWLGLGRMRGNAVDDAVAAPDSERGIDYGSAAITWRFHEYVAARSGLTFGFSHEGFEAGGLFELELGEAQGTQLTVGVEGISTLGVVGDVRLGWSTLPNLPMGATIEITNYPTGEDAGVRLLYDIAYRIYPGAHVRLEAGYRGFTSTSGGVSASGEVVLAF